MRGKEGKKWLSEIFCLHKMHISHALEFMTLSGIINTTEHITMAARSVPVTTHGNLTQHSFQAKAKLAH